MDPHVIMGRGGGHFKSIDEIDLLSAGWGGGEGSLLSDQVLGDV